jgi:hypothetical protein
MIAGLRRSGTTVLLTSHYLDEVQRLADRVGVMSHGRLAAESTPAALGGRDVSGTVISFLLPARLRGTPLPAWAYLAGRFGSAFVTSVTGCCVLIATAVVFFHVRIVWHRPGLPLGAGPHAGRPRAGPPASLARALAGRTVTNSAK